ncbi:MAG TPA: collagen-binding domain-containing protein, partial [Flavisolibacter sp.]|nr:collagen-binding domain-containing protein [Flavisolibacter sp.]
IYNPYTGNPLSQAQGFNIITKKEFKAKGGQIQGPVAFGGDFELTGTASVANSHTGYYPSSRNNDNGNYSLIVGGKVRLKGGKTTINRGLVRLHIDTTELLFDKDCNGTVTNLKVKKKAASCATSLESSEGLELQQQQTASSAVVASGLDFNAAYTWFNQLSGAINYYGAYAVSITEVVKLSMPATINPTITLAPNKINFVQMSATQLTALATQGTLTFAGTPSSSTPVVFNVVVPNGYTWTPPNIAGLADSANHYIVWHLSAGTVAHNLIIGGSNTVQGTVLAPMATVTKSSTNSINGQLIVTAAEMTDGQVNYFPFLGRMEAFAPTTLPVKLLSFNGTVANNKTQLQWSVGQNEESAYFDVEKSADGRVFAAVAQVKTTGKNGKENYAVTDVTGNLGYYRLKLVSTNGTVSYSGVVKLQAAEKSALQAELLQNPIASSLPLRINAGKAGAATIQVYALSGAKLFTKNITVQKGSTTFTLPLDRELPKGTYLLEVVADGERSLVKMMK